GTWHLVVRSSADRAGVFHPRLRQDDRRRGVQSRLPGGARRRPGDCVYLCDAEFTGGCPLRGDQSQAAPVMTERLYRLAPALFGVLALLFWQGAVQTLDVP